MTPQLLAQVLRCTPAMAERYAAPLEDACRAYGIDTPARLAAFLAQVGHETGSLRYVAEVWGPTDAQRRYEGRKDLGNTEPGDGFRFRGRGLIQTTGRANYRQLTQRLRARGVECPDFEAEPDELLAPWWAALSAADYWDSRNLNALADAGDFVTLTRRINGGTNGLADRQARWEVAKAVLVKGNTMPLPALAAALLPTLTSAIPDLVKLIRPDSESAQQNAAVAAKAFEIAKAALDARNEQEVAELVQNDPVARQTVREAVEARWFELAEAGGGGIEGARKADADARQRGDLLQSPSLWIGLMLLPLVYILVLSLIGAIGSAQWGDDVRAGLAGSITSSIVGGLVGYYFGQTTSRNRTQA